jgi:hypothetical protein
MKWRSSQVLDQVQASTLLPILLTVGENNSSEIDLNQQPMVHLLCEKQLKIIPKATHLSEEPKALSEVDRFAGLWFHQHLLPPKELGPHLTNLDEEGNWEEL